MRPFYLGSVFKVSFCFKKNMRISKAFQAIPFLCFALVFFQVQNVVAQYPGLGDPGARSSGGGNTGAGLVAVTPDVDAGSIAIGSTAQVVVRFRNDNNLPIETGLIRLYPSSNVSGIVSLNQCQEEPLTSGAECAIAISVKSLQAGAWRIEMLMSHTGRSRLVTATLSGVVETAAEGQQVVTSDIEASPAELDFGDMEESQTLVESITLRNITSKPIDVRDIYIDTSEQAGYSLKTECDTLGPGQACIAVVTWSPKLSGRSSGVLVINHSGPTGLTSVPLEGTYDPGEVDEATIFPRAVPGRGLLVSSQTELDFGDSVSTASTITVSLVNAGDAPLNIETIEISGSDNGLSFKEGGCAAQTILEPIEACPLTLTWSPTRVGGLFDDVQITHDGARGVLVLPVRGASEATVSQDQKAIVLSGGTQIATSGASLSSGYAPDADIAAQQATTAQRNASTVASTPVSYNSSAGSVVNAASTLDGYKITSFSTDRAIISGPGGSRIVFDNEDVLIGGVPWFVVIQRNGIEFLHHGQRVLLLFDRSLSAVSGSTGVSSSAATDG